ncbi:putative chemotaxis protein MotB [Hyphomonas adhaerens MHS-3]|uniref:Putative chemotaxis protein MotB n=2 Tax=Hyphomonas adhaerens TaxID=81029 RepID=A0A069E0C2_9PROT|nr:putative chemotaxis protein MotB [Hyphomonas adhaerens MHS-3]
MAYASYSSQGAGRMPVAPARKAGTWKMAYADFLTALMAFFLLMWLVSGVSADDRAEIADYFHNRTPDAATAVAVTSGASAADRVFSALSENPALVAAGSSVVLAKEADGIRIDLVDTAERPLFNRADGRFTDTGRALAHETATALAGTEGTLVLEGHTDAFPSLSPGYSNWELSSDRANEARRVFEAAGIASERIRGVAGLADTRPLVAAQPHLPVNRRVSILVQVEG